MNMIIFNEPLKKFDDMDLALINLLKIIESTGSITKAAEHCKKAPSALSYQVSKYEKALGITLLRPQGRGICLTEAATFLVAEGQALESHANAIKEQAIRIGSGVEPLIRIAVDEWVSLEQVMQVFDQFLSRYPDVELQVEQQALEGTWEALLTNSVDLVIGAIAPKPSGVNVQTISLRCVERVFAVAQTHPLASVEGPLSASDLEKHRWIIVRDSAKESPRRDTLGFAPHKRLVVDSMQAKLQAQRAGLGIGFLPGYLATPYIASSELVTKTIADAPPMPQLLMAWRTDSRGAGLRDLIEECSSLIQHN